MRLEDLRPEHLRLAIERYCHHAWPGALRFAPSAPASAGNEGLGNDELRATLVEPGKPGPRVPLEPLFEAETTAAQLELLERGDRGDDPDLRRYTLRLGNARYPFMKFVLQEHLVAGEFFFSVDTHDRLDVGPSAPDFEEWEQLKRYNRALSTAIEEDWHARGLPTHVDLERLLRKLAAADDPEDQGGTRILIVDDDQAVAGGLAALLRARGYLVDRDPNGDRALERLASGDVPDLVLLDVEMPGCDGQEVLRRIRGELGLPDLLVLLATASTIDLSCLPPVAGFLQKPYPRQVLFEMIDRLTRDA
jgi:CheY-like chemotaxis protein